jgi:hypothetical protein
MSDLLLPWQASPHQREGIGTSGAFASPRTAAACSLLAVASYFLWSTAALAGQCALDRITFQDSRSGHLLEATRVAVHYHYACGDNTTGVVDAPIISPGDDCRGPFGDILIETHLATSPSRAIFAVYHIEDAVPCCGWFSYSDLASAGFSEVHWLAPSLVLKVPFPGFGIAPNPYPMEKDSGPLAGHTFVAHACSESDNGGSK